MANRGSHWTAQLSLANQNIFYIIFYFSLCEQHSQINNVLFLILFFNSYFFACELGIKSQILPWSLTRESRVAHSGIGLNPNSIVTLSVS